MSKSRNIELISELIHRTELLNLRDNGELDSIKSDSEMIIRNIFSEDSIHIKNMKNIMFHPSFAPSSEEYRVKIWMSGQRSLINLFNSIKRELEIFRNEEIIDTFEKVTPKKQLNDNIFVVHGHDEAMRLEVTRTLEKLGLMPIILHEQEDDGLTVIEKFENKAIECDFALILLSPDDIGYNMGADPSTGKHRARQNVILELGYFVGKIGRSSVMTIKKDHDTGALEVPSDFAGVIYTPFDSNGGWKLKLVKALKFKGYNVSADNL